MQEIEAGPGKTGGGAMKDDYYYVHKYIKLYVDTPSQPQHSAKIPSIYRVIFIE